MVGLFGSIPFVCSDVVMLTFRNLGVERSARFAKHEIIGRTPALEFVGADASEVSIDIQLNVSFGVSPASVLRSLRGMLETHLPYSLSIGPEYFGMFVLTGLSEERKAHSGAGVLISADVKLKLLEAQ